MFDGENNMLLWVVLAFLEDGTTIRTSDRGCASSSAASSARARFFLLALVVDLVAIAIVVIVVVWNWRGDAKVE